MAYSNCLLNDEFLAEYSFNGIVLNLNVATNIHYEAEDLNLCLIIVGSHCIAGDLVLRELEIVLAQRV